MLLESLQRKNNALMTIILLANKVNRQGLLLVQDYSEEGSLKYKALLRNYLIQPRNMI